MARLIVEAGDNVAGGAIMTWMIVPIIAALICYVRFTSRVAGPFGADSIFVYTQTLMAVGTLPLLEPSVNKADSVHGWVILWSSVVFMVVSSFMHRVVYCRVRFDTARDRSDKVYKPGMMAMFGIGACLAIVALYFYALGYSAFFEGVKSVLGAGGSDLATLRLDSYSGPRYLFPGYVNQVKNALLPAMVLLVIVYRSRVGRPRIISSLVLGGFALVALLGTGQRGPLFTFILVLVAFYNLYEPGMFRRRFFMVCVLAAPLALLSTAALGRSGEKSSSWVGALGDSFMQLFARITDGNQRSSVAGFRYVYQQPVEVGREWREAFLGLLPGQPGSTLSNEVFAQLFGSDRGTSPVSTWGSVYHNFGFFGIAVAPVLLAILCASVTNYVHRVGATNSLESLGLAGVCVALGTWMAGSPTYMINVGIVVYAALALRGRALRRAESSEKVVEADSRGYTRSTDENLTEVSRCS